MKQSAQPYLHFEGLCRQAMVFYQELFGGDLEIMIISESPVKDQFPAELQDQVLHASLTNEAFRLRAADMCGAGELIQGNSFEILLDCTSEDELRMVYNKLSIGGTISLEPGHQFWGSLFGMVIDKFGVRWMLSYEEKNQ